MTFEILILLSSIAFLAVYIFIVYGLKWDPLEGILITGSIAMVVVMIGIFIIDPKSKTSEITSGYQQSTPLKSRLSSEHLIDLDTKMVG